MKVLLPWLIYRLCELIDHRGPTQDWYMDSTGEFMVRHCLRCKAVVIQEVAGDHDIEDYQDVLEEFLG